MEARRRAMQAATIRPTRISYRTRRDYDPAKLCGSMTVMCGKRRKSAALNVRISRMPWVFIAATIRASYEMRPWQLWMTTTDSHSDNRAC